MSLQHHSIKQAYDLPVGTEVTLHGWVRSRRDSKGVTFIELNDGSRFKSMQLVVDAGVVSEETLKQVTTGSSVAASGVLVESPAKGQAVELKVSQIKIYGTADPATYPLQKKGHTLEQHLRRGLPRAQRADPRDSHVLSEERFHLCADAHHYHLGLRGGGTNVQRDFVEFA